MAVDMLFRSALWFEFIALVVLLFIFGRFALKARTRSSLQFQLFVFLLIFVIAEIPRALWNLNLIDLSYYREFGLSIHAFAMVLFAGFVLFRLRRAQSPDRREAKT